MASIEFVMCFDKKYAEYAKGTMLLLWQKNKDVFDDIHFLFICEEDVKSVCSQFYSLSDELQGTSIDIYFVLDTANEILDFVCEREETDKRFPHVVFYRLFASDYSKYSKSIYVDVDTMPVSCAKDLYEVDVSDYSFAAVLDGSLLEDTYVPWSADEVKNNYAYEDAIFSSGVLLMNNLKLRRFDMLSYMVARAAIYGKFKFFDMSFINDSFRGDILKVDKRFNEQDMRISFDEKQMPKDTVFFSFLLSSKPWAYEGKFSNRYKTRELKQTFIDAVNSANKKIGIAGDMTLSQFQVANVR